VNALVDAPDLARSGDVAREQYAPARLRLEAHARLSLGLGRHEDAAGEVEVAGHEVVVGPAREQRPLPDEPGVRV
jgi:hypothetical protein